MLEHLEWDEPNCVGRLLNAIYLWENSTGQRVENQGAMTSL